MNSVKPKGAIPIDTNRAKLALDGGTPVRTAPLPIRRLYGDAEKNAVMALFDAAIAQGHQILGYNGAQEEAFCKEFADFHGGGFADAVNSGTTAVYVALRSLELPANSEVIVPGVSDPGGVMPVTLCNCTPIAADAAPGTYNIGAEQIRARLTDRTRAIIVAHISGMPADLDPIMELARARNLPVIEDCAQSHGAMYKGRRVGSIGDVAAFSTMFGKHFSTGGQGGVVFTRSRDLYWKIRRYADRGKPFGLDPAPAGNVVASLNLNMDELHCAIGREQLRKLPWIIERRRQIAHAIARGCAERLKHVRLMAEPRGCEGSYWFLFFRGDWDSVGCDKQRFVRALVAEGITAADPTYLSVPVRMPWHQGSVMPLPNVEATDAAHFRVAFHEDWTDREVEDLICAMEKIEQAFVVRATVS